MKTMITLALAFVALTVLACGGGGGSTPDVGTLSPPPGTSGTLRIYVTDAPFPFDSIESATITVQEIRVRDASEAEDTGWTTVFEGPVDVDLVPLTGGAVLPIVEADLPAGTYDQVRVIVDAGEVHLKPDAFAENNDPVYTVANGRLKFPSAAQSGLKVKIDGGIVVVTQLSSDLTLDFDLSKNFVFNGPISHPPGVKGVIFTPVIRATNNSTTGSIQVTTTSDGLNPGTQDGGVLTTASISVYPDGTVDAPTEGYPVEAAANDMGVAVVQGLEPGTYDVVVEAGGHASATLEDLVVVIANLTTAEVTLAASGEIDGTVMSDNATTGDDTDDFSLGGVSAEAFLTTGGDAMGSDTSNDSGIWAITDLGAGTYDVVFKKAGFKDAKLEGVNAALDSMGYLVTMASLTRTLSGTVSDNAGVVGGATVSLESPLGTVISSTTTDATLGSWSLSNIPTRSYSLVITSSDGTKTKTLAVDVVGDAGSTTQTEDADLGA